jgi:hypothetical protein
MFSLKDYSIISQVSLAICQKLKRVENAHCPPIAMPQPILLER